MLLNQIKKVFSSSFIKDVIKLTLGTVAGRIITIAALPLITRIYSPNDFALLATYTAIVSTISVAACLRFEIAIPLADNDKEARDLLILSFTALTSTTIITIILSYWLSSEISKLVNEPKIQSFIYLIPLGIAGTGIYSIMQYWATRARRFSQIAKTRITQALVSSGVTLTLGWLGITPLGLLIGNVLNTSAGGLKLITWSIKNEIAKLKGVKRKHLLLTLNKYKRYPIYSTPESLFNNAGVQVPIILIAANADTEAGYLLLSITIMAAPMLLLGGSISQVYATRAPQAWAEGKLIDLTHLIMRQLFKIGFFLFSIAGISSPFVVPYVFGPNWSRTGEIISWLAPWMLLQFIASPVSIALHVTGNQSYAMILQGFGLILRISAVLIAVQIFPNRIVETFAVSCAFFYLICLATINKVSSTPKI